MPSLLPHPPAHRASRATTYMGLFVNRITRRLSFLVAMSCLKPIAAGLLAQALPQPERITDRQGLPQAFVPSIVQDRQGFIWTATRDGLCRYDGSRFKVFQPDPDGRPSLSFTGLEKLVPDHHGKIWISSDHSDIDIFDPRTETFINVSRRADYRRLMANNKLAQFHVDRRDRLWSGIQQGGLICFDRPANQIRHFRHQLHQPGSLSSDSVMNVGEAADGIIWIATRAGVDRFDESTQQFVHYRHRAGNPNSLPDDQLKGLHMLSNGNVLLVSKQHISSLDPRSGRCRTYPLPVQRTESWGVHFARDSRGVLYFDQGNVLFRFTQKEGPQVVARWTKPIDQCASLYIDRSDVLWIGTNGAGIQKYDLRPNPFRTEPYRRNFYLDLLTGHWLGVPASQRPNPVAKAGLNSYNFRYTIDNKGQTLWYNVGSADVYQISLKTGTTLKVPLPIPSYEGNNIDANPCPLATDSQNRVWAIHGNLIWWFDPSKRQWSTFPHTIPISRTTPVLAFVADKQALWLATKDGGLWRLDKVTGRLRQYANQPGDSASLSSNSLFCLSAEPTDANRLWVGTFGGGLCAFDKRTGKFRRFTIREGLPNNVIYSVIPDQRGDLWMGTNKGICRLNRKTGQTKTYTRIDGLMADEFNRFHWLHLPDDRIIMGGLEGITAFYPRQVGEDSFAPSVEFTNLQINNQSVQPGPDSPLGNLPIQAITGLTLSHNQNFITADFAVLQFNSPGKNRYRYRLEGLEDDWKETDRPVATYTNLPPNDYVLMLNASNTSGQWSRHVRRLAITIRSPFWATWWAYLAYGLLVISIGYWLIRNAIGRLRMQQSITLKEKENALQHKEITLQHKEAEQRRAVDTLKTNFFTNITHEFRTPLTLILGPAEQMVSENPDPKNRRRLQTIEQNAHQLLRLINQLLDLSKLEASVMPIHESRGDLAEFITHWLRPLTDQATGQGLSLTFTSEVAGDYWFDAEKLERIVYNLTANALKFTKVGTIAVLITTLSGRIRLTVTDTGVGIPAQHLPHIFDRFYQVSDAATTAPEYRWCGNPTTADRPGTGIGLALVHELVQLQGGQISVESQLNQGTTFVVELPYRLAEVPETEPGRSRSGVPAGAVVAPSRREANDDAWTAADESDQPRLLVVEDNDELARFIADSLPEHYRIRRAANGRDGLEQALEHQPDLIISDVMMPLMDGFTLCGQLKTDLRSNHIPVILLTAKASVDNRLAGLALGADDYLTKPFLVAELQLRVRNLLDRQRRQRDRLKTHLTTLPELAKEADAPDSDPFVENIYRILDTNLDDSTFGADELAAQVGMSRGHLYRKLKALTDLSVNEVIRNYRLKRAGQYLRLGHPVAETGYMVGFESPSYFTKCFRELYGLPPSDYSARLN